MAWWRGVVTGLLVWGPDREWVRGDLEEGYCLRRSEGRPALAWWARSTLASAAEGARAGVSRSPSSADVVRELRQTLRSLRRAPVFTVTTILTLALGIGSAAGIYNLVDAVVLQPLSIDPEGRLVRLWDRGNVDAQTLDRFADSRAFEAVTGLAAIDLTLVTEEQAHRVTGAAVSPAHFGLLGAEAQLGRLLGATDVQPGAPPVVVLSHGLWARAFGSDPEIVGRTVRLAFGDVPAYTVVGVLPRDFRDVGYVVSEAWIPLTPDFIATAREAYDLFATARLAEGTLLEDASASVMAIAAEQRRLDPRLNGPEAVENARAIPLRSHLVQEGTRTQLILLLIGACIVFLIACGNAVNLLLARSTRRAQELAVRRSLGGGRAAVVRLLMVEAGLLGFVGGSVGAVGAWLTEAALLQYVGQLGVPRLDDVGMGVRVWLFTTALSIGAAVLIGLVPALRMTRARHAMTGLGSRARGSSAGARGLRVNQGLVAAQVALAVPVVAAAVLLARSSRHVASVETGVSVESVVTVRVLPTLASDADVGVAHRFHERLRAAFAEIPGVERVASTTCLPMGRCSGWTRYWSGDEQPAEVNRELGFVRSVSPGYLETQGIRVLAGRGIVDGDRAGAEPVVVVSESMADELFPRGAALGARVRLSEDGPLRSVVGIAADVRHRGPDGETRPTAYAPLAQFAGSVTSVQQMDYVLRYAGSSTGAVPGIVSGMVAEIVAAGRRIDPTMPLADIAPMSEVVRSRTASRRAMQAFLWTLSGLALLLSFGGVYGVSWYVAGLRKREVGIRMAIGAQPGQVAVGTTALGMTPVLVGVAVGTLLAPLATSGMESLLFGVEATDPLTYVAVAAATLLAALVATAAPALHSAATEPAEVLWGEG